MKLNVKNELYVQKIFNWRQIFLKFFATFLMSLCINALSHAQYTSSYSPFFQLPSVHTVTLSPQDSWKQQFVYDFDNNTDLEILLSFDELYADSRQLFFSVRHCDLNWQPDDMLSIEYWDGFEKQYDCSEYTLSFNTTVDYVHYTVHIPIRKFKTSGNFVVSVFSVDDGELVLSRPLLITEHEAGIISNVRKTNLNGMQDLSASIQTRHSQSSPYLPNSLYVGAWQNNDLSSFRLFNSPTAIRGDELAFTDALSFQGGAEWRWADTRSLRGHVLSDTRVEFLEDYFHSVIPLATPNIGYTYHEDFNGLQYIHTYDDSNNNPNTSADYSITHIYFEADREVEALFVVGDLVDSHFPLSMTRMNYVSSTRNTFEASFFVKQSLANFRIVELNDEGTVSLENTESNFSETENDYHICVYYRDPSTGYYRLLGYRRHNTLKTPNSFIH